MNSFDSSISYFLRNFSDNNFCKSLPLNFRQIDAQNPDERRTNTVFCSNAFILDVILIADVDIPDSVLYRLKLIMIRSASYRKTAMSAFGPFDCLFTATSITVEERSINQAPCLSIDVNHELFIIVYFIGVDVKFVQSLNN